MNTDNHAPPTSGGNWVRDPKTGALTRLDDDISPAPTAATDKDPAPESAGAGSTHHQDSE